MTNFPITYKTLSQQKHGDNQSGNFINNFANQNENNKIEIKNKFVLHTSKFIVKSCPLVCLLCTSANLSLVATSNTRITKMVEIFVKNCSPNIKLPTFLAKKVAALPMLYISTNYTYYG